VVEGNDKTSDDPRKAPKTRSVKVERKCKAEDELPTKDDLEVDDGENIDIPDQDEGSGGAHGKPPQGAALLNVPAISPLTIALRNRGANAVDGVPAQDNVPSGTLCSVDAC